MNEHDELRALLARVRRRWFALAALESSGRAMLLAAIPILLAAAIAWALGARGWNLVGLMALATTAAAGGMALVFFRMPARPDDCQVARFVEERAGTPEVAPALCDALVSAVRVIESPDRHGGGFGALLVNRALHALRGIDPSTLSRASRCGGRGSGPRRAPGC